MSPKRYITLKGCKEHNLKNIDVSLPRDQLVVVTGLSGSGKSSLVFDTIYAEGQRRYVESLSTYARQFLEMMEKPDVDSIDGLSPAVSIDQKSSSRNPRSTVGTVTEIYDYLRLLFAKVGLPHCPVCNQPVERQSVQQITDTVLASPKNSKLMILAPLVVGKKGEHIAVFDRVKRAGFVRLRIDGEIVRINELKPLEKNKSHTIEVVIDRLQITDEMTQEDTHRVADSVETALKLGEGVMRLLNTDNDKEEVFSEHFSCPQDGVNIPEITPRSFSFNSPHGACPDCHGLGTKLEIDPAMVIPNQRLTIAEGAIIPWSKTSTRMTWYLRLLMAVADKFKFSVDTPVEKLSDEIIQKVLYGTGDEKYRVKSEHSSIRELEVTFEGVIPNLERRYHETESDYIQKEIEKFMRVLPCPTCMGKRLRPEILAVTINDKSIIDVTALSIKRALDYFQNLNLTETQQQIARLILREITNRLQFLMDVGLGYLTLERTASTLSGGEAQRIRLATQIGSQLTGVLYVLDEPSIGLHQRDNDRLIQTLQNLRDIGNTVIVVEHDEETILAADWVVDVGPGAGRHGGQIVAEGTPLQVKNTKGSLTGDYLSGRKEIPLPEKYRSGDGRVLKLSGASEHNLKKVSAEFPLGTFIGVTGVSGSGKSTLINDILVKILQSRLMGTKTIPGAYEEISGVDHLDKIISIDQKPIGRTPRSNPATYTGVFTDIREMFAETPEAKLRGYKSGRFSFNVKGGRCESCRGDGIVKIEMHFLPDIYVPCEVCKGKRYNREALEIHYKGKNIHEVLEMTAEEACSFFSAVPKIYEKLTTLVDVGLGYIKMGQPATTLSGGEAQRIKLATELSRRATGRTFYVLDEPTTGLHFADVERLVTVLHQLVESGNTVLTIEHNLDVIKTCDYLIDLGPEGGEMGGEIIATGTPEDVAAEPKSHTGEYLARIFERAGRKINRKSAKPTKTTPAKKKATKKK
jgi:excinuclease ABC subunit A